MIHATAIVSPEAKIGANCSVGPFSIIHDKVEIGDGTVVGSHCELGVPAVKGEGAPLRIGNGGFIRSYSVFYEGSTFASGLVTGHRVTVRENTEAGINFQIGTLGDVQGDCKIGDYVRFHSNVHVGKHSTIGNFVWIFPYVVLTNDPHPPSDVEMGVVLKDYCVVATMSTVLPGVVIGERALVAACSNVTKNIPEGRIVSGNPAEDRGSTSRIRLKDGSGRQAYPWTTHFTRGYPEDVVASWGYNVGR